MLIPVSWGSWRCQHYVSTLAAVQVIRTYGVKRATLNWIWPISESAICYLAIWPDASLIIMRSARIHRLLLLL